MQVVRLVEVGVPDKIIAFDSLPESMLQGVRRRDLTGLGRHWLSLGEWHFWLEYKELNRDIEKWSEIQSFVRRAVDPEVRLLDELAQMAVKLAPSSREAVSLEPEDVPVIPIPKLKKVLEAAPKIITGPEEEEEEAEDTETVEPSDVSGNVSHETKKKLGRPKKVAVTA